MDISVLFKTPSAFEAWASSYKPVSSPNSTPGLTPTSSNSTPSLLPSPISSPAANPLPPHLTSHLTPHPQNSLLFPPSSHPLPPRLPPSMILLPLLDTSFAARIKTGYQPLPPLDTTNGRNRPAVEERAKNEEGKKLREHLRDRMPYAHLAGSRLMAVVEARGDLVFELPETKISDVLGMNISPVLRRISAEECAAAGGLGDLRGVSGGVTSDYGGFGAAGVSRSVVADENTAPGKQKLNGQLPLPSLGNQKTNGQLPLTPPKMQPFVDPATGRGLREYLLQKGKEYGMRKVECQSISFHDFTPKGPEEEFSNVLLAHYEAGKSERIAVYEVNLPATEIDPATGEERYTTEPWIWFFISKPTISLQSEYNTPRIPSATQNPQGSPAYSSPSFSESDPEAMSPSIPSLPNTPTATSYAHPKPPPNFPTPIPASWVVFASPLSYITAHPEASDPVPMSTLMHRRRSNPPAVRTLPSVRPFKRRDYDLTHNGVPIFEFSSSTFTALSAAGPKSKHTPIYSPPFLSVDGLPAWDAADQYEAFSAATHAKNRKTWYREGHGERFGTADGLLLGRVDARGGPVVDAWRGPPPYRGVWWNLFYRGAWADGRMWEEIRASMGRGRCRVVVKFEEGADGLDMDVEMSGTGNGQRQGLGLGIRWSGNGSAVGRKVSKERLAVPRHPHMTRSVVRKRSALGLGEEEPLGALMADVNGVAGGRPKKVDVERGENEKVKVRKTREVREEDEAMDLV